MTYCNLVGITEKAARKKIEDGVWLIGRQYRKDPQGRLWIDIRGVEKWVAGG